jgi:hypothetical protein
MKLIFEPLIKKLLLAEKQCALPAAAASHWLAPATGFPQPQTKVALISVDTAFREVPSPGQKGFCVQWR